MTGVGTHQTIRIERGRHSSPAEGACVMELSSMLAGERFSDRPRCVDPVVAAFLRTLNDRLAPRDRQRLLPYASAAVGTRGRRRDTRRRRRMCGASRPVVALLVGVLPALRFNEGAGEWAARRFVAANDVAGALAFLDALVGASPRSGRDAASGSEPAPLPLPVEHLPQLRVTRPAAALVVDAQVVHDEQDGHAGDDRRQRAHVAR